jgi:hypothetical protein
MARNKDQHLIGLFNHFLELKESKELINTINEKYEEMFYSYNEEFQQQEVKEVEQKAKKEVKNPDTTQSEQAKLVRKELLEKGTQKTLKIVEEEKPFELLKKVKS